MPSRRIVEEDSEEAPLFSNPPLPRSTSRYVKSSRRTAHADASTSSDASPSAAPPVLSSTTSSTRRESREFRETRESLRQPSMLQRAPSAKTPLSSLPVVAVVESVPETREVSAASQVQAQATLAPNRSRDVEMGRGPGNSEPTEPMLSNGKPSSEPDTYHDEETPSDYVASLFWKCVMLVVAVGPWKFIRGLAFVINRWQRVCRPVSHAVFYASDLMDKHMPTVRNTLIWLWSLMSLAWHVISVLLTFLIINILYKNSHHTIATVMVLLYCLSHYLMAVIMYFEMDRVKTHMGRYTAHDFFELVSRVVHVVFWDVQLLASLIHSNFMIEGLTQMILKGYEEARVCLHVLVNTIPACVMLGVLYDPNIKVEVFSLKTLETIDIVHVYGHQLYAALAFSIINSLDKLVRLSLADPWMHAKLDDGYPLVYMRSNAARIPHGLVLNWLFRCNTQLQETDGELRLRELFSVYTINSKGQIRELSDGHKSYLVKKVFRMFNSKSRLHKAEVLARRLDKGKFRHTHSIMSLNANRIKPGPDLSSMLGEVLSETRGFTTLLLSGNDMGDLSVAVMLDGVKRNDQLQLEHLDLSSNRLGHRGCEAVAQYIVDKGSLLTLNLSGNPLTDAGARALAEAMVRSNTVQQLDLSCTSIGPESGATLGAMLRANNVLRQLNLSGTALGSAGLDQLSKGLRNNTGLQDLDVSKTALDDRACVGFAQAITANRTLLRLNLSGTQIGDAGAKLLCDALQQNGVINNIDLADTPMDRSWVKLISNITRSGH